MSLCTHGVADVFRQVTDDVLPGLVANISLYDARATRELAVENIPFNPTGPTSSSPANSCPKFPTPSSFNLENVGREFLNVFNRAPEGLFTPEFRVLLIVEGVIGQRGLCGNAYNHQHSFGLFDLSSCMTSIESHSLLHKFAVCFRHSSAYTCWTTINCTYTC